MNYSAIVAGAIAVAVVIFYTLLLGEVRQRTLGLRGKGDAFSVDACILFVVARVRDRAARRAHALR